MTHFLICNEIEFHLVKVEYILSFNNTFNYVKMNLPRDVFEVLSWQNVCHFKLLKIIDIYIVKNVVSKRYADCIKRKQENDCILNVEKTVN